MTTTVSAIDLPFQEAIDFLKAKANVTSGSYLDVWGRANVKSFTVAGAATQALVPDFRGARAGTLARGPGLSRSGSASTTPSHGTAGRTPAGPEAGRG